MKETIYIGIPSLEDSELVHTVSDCLESADNPDRIFVGIAYSTDLNNFKLKEKLIKSLKDYKQISYVFLNWKKKYGAGNGRIEAGKLYSGQDYFFQIDSHIKFDKGWDNLMIEDFKQISSILNTEKVVITGYPSEYYYDSNKNRVFADPLLKVRCPMYSKGTLGDRFNKKIEYMDMMPNWDDDFPEIIWSDSTKKFYPSPKVAGSLVFGGRHFAENYSKWYPYPPMFYDEEIIQSIELVNDGYMIVCPQTRVPVAHLYYDLVNEFGGQRRQTDLGKSLPFIKDYVDYLNNNLEKVEVYKDYSGMNLLTKEIEFDMVMPSVFNCEENKL